LPVNPPPMNNIKEIIEEEIGKIKNQSEVINDSLWYVNPDDIRQSQLRLLAGIREMIEGELNKCVKNRNNDKHSIVQGYANEGMINAFSHLLSSLPETSDKDI
jgi:hypothetical protein